MNTISSPVSPATVLSSDEVSKARDYLTSTRDSLFETVANLSDSQWHFKPAPDRWSVVETLEHVVIIEERIHGIIGGLQNAPPSEPDRIDSQVDAAILAKVPDRSTKLQAPPTVLPSHQWSPTETLARFCEGRARTVELLGRAPFLRGHVVPHPFAGLWDGYQWILAAAAHSARHTGQILEVKACSGIPQPHAA